MDYTKIEDYFMQNNAKEEIDTRYKSYQIKWQFEGFEDLIEETRFISRISLNLDFEMNMDVMDTIDNRLKELKEWFKTLKDSIQKYLNEIVGKDGRVAKIYLEFLNAFYKNFKDYINDGLIPYVFSETFHNPIVHLTQEYDPTRYIDSKFDKLELKMMKKFRELLKQIETNVEGQDKQVFGILIDSYKEKIETTEKEYHMNKKLAQL